MCLFKLFKYDIVSFKTELSKCDAYYVLHYEYKHMTWASTNIFQLK